MRKIHKIRNINDKTGKVYFVSNLKQFCKDKGIVYRNIFYTRNGERNVANGWKLLESIDAYSFEERWGIKHVYSDNFEEVLADDAQVLCYIEKPKQDEDIKTEPKQKDKPTVKIISPQDRRDNVAMESQHTQKDEVLENELAKARKQIQSLQDKLRIERKVNREVMRKDNIKTNFEDKVVELLKVGGLSTSLEKKTVSTSLKTLIVQLSDLHFGKVVDLPNNKFNLKVARQRLHKYYESVRQIIINEDISIVDIVFTGDMFNNEHHIDSLLTNEDTRAKSFIEGVDIIAKFIENIHNIPNVSLVSLAGVVGNESRVKGNEYQSNVNKIVNNNFDTMMFGMLKLLYKDTDSILFANGCDKLYDVVRVGHGTHVAIIHGDKLKRHNNDEVLKMKVKLEERYGVKINYTIMGHIHETCICSEWGRSGSIVGIDEYASDSTLNIPSGTASQNVYYVDCLTNTVEGREIKLACE